MPSRREDNTRRTWLIIVENVEPPLTFLPPPMFLNIHRWNMKSEGALRRGSSKMGYATAQTLTLPPIGS